MKILILGGNRFVGKQLSEELFTHNEIDIFNRSGTGISNINIIQGDRNNKSDLEKINFDKYDCIVDMCLYKVEQFNLIKDLIPRDTNYIFVSSGAVDYAEAFGEYGIEKRNLEEELIKTALNYKIVRPSYVVGRGTHRPRLGYFIDKLKNNEIIELSSNENYPINLVFVQDVVECLFQLAVDKNKTMKNYDICGDESISVNNLIQKLLRYYPTEYVTIQSSTAPFKNTEFTEFDNSAIKQDYDVTFTSLAEGIKDYVNWFKEEGLKKYGYIV